MKKPCVICWKPIAIEFHYCAKCANLIRIAVDNWRKKVKT